MSNTKHTKGPWKYFDDKIIYDAGYGGPFYSICTLDGNNNEANANLIKAAPDLLEALELLISELDASGDIENVTYGTGSLVVNAIAKAKGE